ncbi:unnamed protein product [marine sediment metagenome]|uniref:Uncharacterized protein n=1 Tax=marine sediment metagenome TaxID=412755 RepID=X1AT27_9ZZZZ
MGRGIMRHDSPAQKLWGESKERIEMSREPTTATHYPLNVTSDYFIGHEDTRLQIPEAKVTVDGCPPELFPLLQELREIKTLLQKLTSNQGD